MSGKLIVIDGIDGSGKTTQIELLIKYFSERDFPYQTISFPRYEHNLYGKLIRRYLAGEFGSISQVNPYLVALAYAGDRALAKPLIEEWLRGGKVVIINRYVSSSKAHLGANLPEEKREEFFKWLDDLEYKTNNIPKEDFTILLDVDPKIGQQNVQKDHRVDLHESNIEHEQKAAKIYFELSQAEENWVVIDCMENGKMRPKEQIHQEIVKSLSSYLI
ncbi:thymidylate kinase [Candidatus Daviesbacteria bacterium]|nr:thymidylate kinase [Candidatus Daviesbacteria bacterium]